MELSTTSPPHAEAAVFRRLTGLELRRAVVVENVLIHRLEQEGSAQADTGEDQPNGKQTLVTSFHSDLLRGQPTTGRLDARLQQKSRRNQVGNQNHERQDRARPDVPCVFSEGKKFHIKHFR
jgi:hypothetical protein